MMGVITNTAHNGVQRSYTHGRLSHAKVRATGAGIKLYN